MTNDINIGTKGEDIASEYLITKGHMLIARNWRYKHKEIDIITRDKEYIVFVEIKTRKDDCIISPLDSVTKKKQKFIIEAANAYLEKYDIDLEVRFDIVTVIYGPRLTIEHIEDAFYPKVK